MFITNKWLQKALSANNRTNDYELKVMAQIVTLQDILNMVWKVK